MKTSRPEVGQTKTRIPIFASSELASGRWSAFTTNSFPVALRDDDNVGALRQLRWMDGRRIVHAADADGLQALFTPHDFADHAGALAGGLEAAASETGHMQENVGKVVIRHDKPVPL